MPDFFANPLGFLGLLAVPAILIIHLLREKSRRVLVSTLFLLDPLAPQTPRGRTLHFLQNSPALWLQLLIALLGAWLLVQPRWLRSDSQQRIVVILDDTASMSAFRARVLDGLPRVLGAAARAATHTDWTLATTDEPETPLYRGPELRRALAALDAWQPVLPQHDPARAFALAQIDLRAGGTILFVSDHPPDALPAGITLLAFGHPIDNCGFAGVKTSLEDDGPHWEALVKNSGTTPQERDWWMETDHGRSDSRKLRLAPGEIATIPGRFPEGEKRLRLCLSPDEFALDDVLPLVAPEVKPLAVFLDVPPLAQRFFERVMAAVPGVKSVKNAAQADVALVLASAAATLLPNQSAVLLGPPGDPKARAMLGALTAERHPYTEGLIWDGLLSTGAGVLPVEGSDLPLLWQVRQPMIFLRTRGNARQLFLNFDFDGSNAGRLPAFVLLFSRFFADAQERKAAHFADNFETNQLLPVLPAKAELVADPAQAAHPEAAIRRAPIRPGFFQVREGDRELLAAAAHFGDPREADFRLASSTSLELAHAPLVQRENSVGDPLATLWLALIGAALAGSWAVQAPK
jgi:Aerotolerance regulator N-terminal